MFGFFNKKKASIQSVEIPSFGWINTKNDGTIQQWINEEQTKSVSVNFFDLPPDLPTIKDLTTLRAFYRDQVLGSNGGIIEIEKMDLKGLVAIKTIFKFAQEPSGMSYVACLTIPFKKCSYVIKIQALEAGMTGVRDTVVYTKLMTEGKLPTDSFEGWASDPYDSSIEEGSLMNLSEDKQYDAQFPTHPLSVVRALLQQMIGEVKFGKELQQITTFNK